MGGAETRLEVASLAEKFDGTRGLTLDGQNSAQPVVRRGRFGMLLCNRLVDFSALVQLARRTERFAQGPTCGQILGVLAQHVEMRPGAARRKDSRGFGAALPARR